MSTGRVLPYDSEDQNVFTRQFSSGNTSTLSSGNGHDTPSNNTLEVPHTRRKGGISNSNGSFQAYPMPVLHHTHAHQDAHPHPPHWPSPVDPTSEGNGDNFDMVDNPLYPQFEEEQVRQLFTGYISSIPVLFSALQSL